jgi:hypothetical protein
MFDQEIARYGLTGCTPYFVLPLCQTMGEDPPRRPGSLYDVINGILGLSGIYREYAGFKWEMTGNCGAIPGKNGKFWATSP